MDSVCIMTGQADVIAGEQNKGVQLQRVCLEDTESPASINLSNSPGPHETGSVFTACMTFKTNGIPGCCSSSCHVNTYMAAYSNQHQPMSHRILSHPNLSQHCCHANNVLVVAQARCAQPAHYTTRPSLVGLGQMHCIQHDTANTAHPALVEVDGLGISKCLVHTWKP